MSQAGFFDGEAVEAALQNLVDGYDWPILVLVSDDALTRQKLRLKLEEYRERLARDTDRRHILDSICKIAAVEVVLASTGPVSGAQVFVRINGHYGAMVEQALLLTRDSSPAACIAAGGSLVERTYNAMVVISDYILTGGRKLKNSTGLKAAKV